MTQKIDELARRRAVSAGNSQLWSPTDCLLDAVEYIERMKTEGTPVKKCLVVMIEDHGEVEKTSKQYASLTTVESIAYLSLALHQEMSKWRGTD